jgi:hypothetical protein
VLLDLAAKMELNLAVRLERDALAPEEAYQVNDEQLRALHIACGNPDVHHDPLSLPLAQWPVLVLISETKNVTSWIRNL